MRSIFDLSTEEAYVPGGVRLGHPLPPLDAVENEGRGRAYVLQQLLEHGVDELAAPGLSRDPGEE